MTANSFHFTNSYWEDEEFFSCYDGHYNESLSFIDETPFFKPDKASIEEELFHQQREGFLAQKPQKKAKNRKTSLSRQNKTENFQKGIQRKNSRQKIAEQKGQSDRIAH